MNDFYYPQHLFLTIICCLNEPGEHCTTLYIPNHPLVIEIVGGGGVRARTRVCVCVRARACVCGCVCARVCVCVCVSLSLWQHLGGNDVLLPTTNPSTVDPTTSMRTDICCVRSTFPEHNSPDIAQQGQNY